MLSINSAFSGFSVDDIEKAKHFYADVIGLKITEMKGMGMYMDIPNTTSVFVYPKPDHEPASYTILNFKVSDITDAVTQLTEAGAQFERYDNMNQDEKGIADHGTHLIAWFKDPAGNILSVIQEVIQ